MNFDEIVHSLSAEDQKVIRDMMVLFESIDSQTSKFAGQSGLKCKSGCGACCESPEVETTVAEALPLAVHLWSSSPAEDSFNSGQAGSILEVLRANPSKSVCIFYRPDPVAKGQGRCSIYDYRPGLCRLFGFAARKDKYGRGTLMTCKVIKDSQPQACERVREGLQKGTWEAPLLTTHAVAVANIDPVRGQKLLPINRAIRLGIEKIGYSLALRKVNY